MIKSIPLENSGRYFGSRYYTVGFEMSEPRIEGFRKHDIDLSLNPLCLICFRVTETYCEWLLNILNYD